MLKYTAIRTVWIFIILWTILSLNFTILRLAPEYPPPTDEEQQIYYRRQVHDGYMTVRVLRADRPQDVEEIEFLSEPVNRESRSHYEIDRRDGEIQSIRIFEPTPISQQYFSWLTNIVTEWNWGLSTRVQVNVPVFEVLRSRIPVTVQLNLIALAFYIPVGFTLGIIAALRKDTILDNLISISVMVMISIPSFVSMLFLVLIFGYQLGWFPTQFPARDITGTIRYTALVLPVLGLSFGAIAGLTRTTRAELTEVLTSEFLLLARTKGLSRPQAVVRHAMRNSMVPLVPGIIFSFVGLLSGSVIIERIYRIPGTGRIFIRAMEPNNYDYNLILGITAFYTIVGLFAVLLVDLSYGIVDPRIRMGARK